MMNEVSTIESHDSEAKFRITFRDVKSGLFFSKKLVSETFMFRDIPWTVSLEVDRFSNHVRFYLNCLETKSGFSCKLSYKIFNVSGVRAFGPTLELKNTTTFGRNVRSDGLDFGSCDKLFMMLKSSSICNNALTLQIEMKEGKMKEEGFSTLKNQEAKEKLIQSLQSSTSSDLVKDFVALLESGDGDVTFKLKDGAIIKAHKNILCARNPVFATMLSVDMTEAMTKEVMIDDMGKDALKILLLHIYSGQLSLPEGLDLVICKDAVNAAEKYNLEQLKEVAGMAVAGFCSASNAIQLFTFCRDHNVEKATEMLATYIKKNVDKVLEKLELCICNM